MQTQATLGQDVIYNRSNEKGECPAKIVRVIDPSKGTVSLVLFTDETDNTSIVRNVPFNESGNLEHSWHHREQAKAAGSQR